MLLPATLILAACLYRSFLFLSLLAAVPMVLATVTLLFPVMLAFLALQSTTYLDDVLGPITISNTSSIILPIVSTAVANSMEQHLIDNRAFLDPTVRRHDLLIENDWATYDIMGSKFDIHR